MCHTIGVLRGWVLGVWSREKQGVSISGQFDYGDIPIATPRNIILTIR